jgi:hypothetical protein
MLDVEGSMLNEPPAPLSAQRSSVSGISIDSTPVSRADPFNIHIQHPTLNT